MLHMRFGTAGFESENIASTAHFSDTSYTMQWYVVAGLNVLIVFASS